MKEAKKEVDAEYSAAMASPAASAREEDYSSDWMLGMENLRRESGFGKIVSKKPLPCFFAMTLATILPGCSQQHEYQLSNAI